ncbi:DUF768 domain-containing protein [Sphingosinicella terrae]|uniref:DUF768 domain-containing protein n=1 Tax=Sphingosinicella terrae TaxID=2172047 RepID=UPI0013B41139|nr:DUF768 domain-containing protein [Sphingosinicella terrae]
MSHRAVAFLEEWVRDNHFEIGPKGIEDCREALLRDAHSLGIGLAEIEEEAGSLDAYLERAILDRSAEQLRRMGESGTSDT